MNTMSYFPATFSKLVRWSHSFLVLSTNLGASTSLAPLCSLIGSNRKIIVVQKRNLTFSWRNLWLWAGPHRTEWDCSDPLFPLNKIEINQTRHICPVSETGVKKKYWERPKKNPSMSFQRSSWWAHLCPISPTHCRVWRRRPPAAESGSICCCYTEGLSSRKEGKKVIITMAKNYSDESVILFLVHR